MKRVVLALVTMFAVNMAFAQEYMVIENTQGGLGRVSLNTIRKAYFKSFAAEGQGTKENPFNVAAANLKCSEIGSTPSSEKFFIKGSLHSVYRRYNTSDASLYIADDESGINRIFVTEVITPIPVADMKVGDEIIVCGSLYNYNELTPEIGAQQIVSYNGQEYELIEAKGTGTYDDPFNVAAAIAKCKETGETATSEKFYIKGIANSDYTVGSYKNIDADLVDEGSSTVFKVYHCKGNNAKDIPEGYQVKKGDVFIVYGPVVNYKNNYPETASGAYIVSINGTDPAGGAGGDTPTPPSGNHGTVESPLTVAQAIAVIDAETTASSCYVKGIICQVDSYNSKYGSITYWISDDGGTTTKLEVYGGLNINGDKFASKDDLQTGKTVVINGNLKKYNEIYEFDLNSKIISIE